MSTYRYLTTNILTGAVIGDWLPIIPQSAVQNINAIGTFTGALNLAAGNSDAERQNNIDALECEQAVLWIFQDQVPVWCGIVWDWPHQSILDNTLPISASTPESLFQKRLISDDLTFDATDVFDIFRGLATYALGKTPNGQMAGFTMGQNKSGVLASVSYISTDLKPVYDAWTDLISGYGFEYNVRPAITADGSLTMVLDLGYPELGLPLESSGLVYQLPGNLLDYQFTRTGSTSANRIYATASSGEPPALNENSDFETGISPWTAVNGATIGQSSAWSNTGIYSLSVHGNGSTALPAARSEIIPVTAGTAYALNAVLYSVQGWANVELVIQWLNSSGGQIYQSYPAAIDVAASTVTTGSLSGVTAPDGAVAARIYVQLAGTAPASSVVMLADDVILSLASAADATTWASALPHGEDDDVLGLGYPLLEMSASLSTITVTNQAQIDSYADGLLTSLTGTQLTPMLTLGAGQIPAARDIVIGSFCYFNATSALHPPSPNGVPGLQATGRVIGWTLYPPSSSQAEYTQIQLGEIEEVEVTPDWQRLGP